jgi:CHAT domain-containing protein
LEMKEPFVTAECNLLEGVLLNKKGKSIQARQKLLEALNVQKSYNQNAAWINYELGISYKIEKDYEKALHYFEEALKIIEKERQALRLSGEATGFLERNRIYYDKYIETLYLYYTEKGKTSLKDDLFSVIEKTKERNFADSLIESHASLEGYISKDLRDRELNILGKISRYNTEVNYAETEQQLQNALLHRDGAEQELEELKLEIRSKNPAYAKLVYPESAGINQLKKLVNSEGTTLVSYFIQGKYLYTFCLTNRDIQLWRTEDALNVNRQTKMLLDLLKTPDPAKADNLKATASSLYRKLLLPVQKAGELGKQLIIIPDEILYYLPFEVLIKPNGKYVVEEHNVTYGPSATSLMLLKPVKKVFKNEFFAMANPAITQPDNPKYQDSDVLSAERGFDNITMKTPLPYTEDEVKNISSLFNPDSCKSYVGKDAKEEVVKNTDLTDYRFLHFATHGIFNEENPYRSGLLFSIDDDPQEDGLLQYREIYNLKTESELVVLSACKTGMGKVVKGEGLIGISRGFLVSGAGSVVVSLWNVSDVSTAFLMSEFYRNIIVRKMPKSEALRQAKITLLRMKTGAASAERGVMGITAGRKTAKAAGFSHPYFWGAFIIIGGAE